MRQISLRADTPSLEEREIKKMKIDVIFKANAKLEIKASTSGRVPQQKFYFVASLVAFICAVFVKGCSPTFLFEVSLWHRTRSLSLLRHCR